jgi:hypothetical protein
LEQVMNLGTTADQLDQNLIAIWQTLHQARHGSARFIEGLIAEIRDDSIAPEQRIASVGHAWWSHVRNPRGIYEFYAWSGNPERDKEANTSFHRNLEQVCRLLEQYEPTFGRPSVPRD